MIELGPEARRLIDSAAGQDDPSRDDRERVRRAVMTAIGAGTGLGGVTAASGALATAKTAGAASAGAAATAGATGIGTLVKLAGFVVLGAGVGLTVAIPRSDDAPRSNPPREQPIAPQPVAVAPKPVRVAPPARTTPEARQDRPARRPAPRLGVRARDSLAAESRLLAQAQRELSSGDPDGALSTLGKHALRYPSGALSPERDAARVIAMCASGKRTQARPLADRFLSAHPASPLAPRVRAACAE